MMRAFMLKMQACILAAGRLAAALAVSRGDLWAECVEGNTQ